MARVERTGYADSLTQQIGPFFQRPRLRSSLKHKSMIQPWNLQHNQFLAFQQGPFRGHNDSNRCKTRTLDRLGNQNRVKRLPRLWEYLAFPFHQIHFCMINAIQALEGLLGPTGSQPSYHAIDFHRGVYDLGRNWRRQEQASQHQHRRHNLLADRVFHFSPHR